MPTDDERLAEEIHLLRSRAALGLMTADLMHDMNNLLTPILLTSSHLASDLPEGRSRKMAELLHTSANLAASLTRNVLALARPRPPLVERVNITDAVREIAPLFERLLRDNMELQLSLDDTCESAMLDRSRLQHALLNLVANARDALPRGGTVTIATRLIQRDGRARIMLTVSDTGIGMPPDVRRNAFCGFFTTKGDSGGLGLGLSSVQRFVAESGGEVTLQSEPMRGTTVTMVFDRAAPATALRAPVVRGTAVSGQGKVILVAARDAGVRNAVQLALDADGYIAFAAGTEEETLDHADAYPVDVAILDDRLVVDGPHLIPHLRRARPDIRLVFMSDRDRASSFHDLLCTVLYKAFSKEDLRRAIRDVLDGS
jgi:anti-sigma regulatory factor (Ser/Thr protein kinase)